MKKTSDYIKEIRALVDIKPDTRYWQTLDGERIPNIYQAHMSALETERQLEHARRIVAELYELLEGSCEGPGLDREREDEIAGLLMLWGIRQNPNAAEAWGVYPFGAPSEESIKQALDEKSSLPCIETTAQRRNERNV